MIVSRKSQGSQDQPTSNTIQDRLDPIESQSSLGRYQGAENHQGEGHKHEFPTAHRSSYYKQETLHRIHIIGGAGSGKSTLARKLSAHLNLPAYHLDEIYLSYVHESEGLLDLLYAEIHRIAAQSGWITEGIYLGWTDELLRTADIIIWLDIPWRSAALRLIIRYVWFGLTNPSSKPIRYKLVGLIRYLWHEILWNERKYYQDSSIIDPGTQSDANAKNRATTTRDLARYGDKLVRYCTPSELEKFLSSIKQEADI